MVFDKLLQKFATKIEKILFRLALVFVAILFVVQASLLDGQEGLLNFLRDTHEPEKEISNQEIEEALAQNNVNAMDDTAQAAQEITLVLEMIPPQGISPKLVLLKNGVVHGKLAKGKSYLNVNPGDKLEIKCETNHEPPIIVKISEVYGNIRAPEEGKTIWTFGGRELLTVVETY